MRHTYHRLIILTLCVVLIHLAFFLGNFSKSNKPSSKKALVINTYYVQPKSTHLQPSVKKQNSVQQKHSSPIAQKRTTLNKKRNSVQQKPLSKKSSLPLVQHKALLKEIGKNFAKMEYKRGELHNTPLLLPKSIDTLQVNCIEKKHEEMGYFALLVSLLKERLELPEWGRVKLELVLLSTGGVQTIRILQAESEKNRRYLEQQLISLLFPPFTEELKEEKTHSFVLTFCNEK